MDRSAEIRGVWSVDKLAYHAWCHSWNCHQSFDCRASMRSVAGKVLAVGGIHALCGSFTATSPADTHVATDRYNISLTTL